MSVRPSRDVNFKLMNWKFINLSRLHSNTHSDREKKGTGRKNKTKKTIMQAKMNGTIISKQFTYT